MRSFLAALQFLTIVPIRTMFDGDEIGRSAAWFPVIGLLIGAVTAAVYVLADAYVFPPLVSVVLAIVVLGAASGGLHLDGLADSADGLLSARPRERALEIMKDSRIGTMGVLALMAVLGLKLAALISLPDSLAWRTVFLAPIAGRCMLVLGLAGQPYARPEGGLATVFLANRKAWHWRWAVAFMLAASVALLGAAGLAAALAVLGITVLFNAYCRRRIGGITGDTLGAACELAELTVLLVASSGARDLP